MRSFSVISCVIWCLMYVNRAAATEKYTLPTPEEGCGFSKVTHKKIVGGTPAKLGAWPWMALIGYTDNEGDLTWRCGGSLITAKHVLTAYHCLKSTLTTVRLGEHDLSDESETNIVDIPVVKVRGHPDYSKLDKRNDLAVLYMERAVEFSTQIRPICIPINDPLRSKDYVESNPFAAGWGLTEKGSKSSILLEVQVPVLSNEECKEKYNAIKSVVSQKQFDSAVLCAGIPGKDSCKGDSGGPLMAPEFAAGKFVYYQIGIISYGIGCAENVPGVYARVQTYVDWIQQRVAE
ncbi:Venom serine protease Bi-VSP [Pseudolycoriella hygida]|uniref:limulus clotting factor C n=1 Tax=Pseudolycoriella hygida TaxID=35572 RepID=A0A9Q0N4P6_9DIPT|nr:Venom serine protease Bi-VSP [Pseudolycoriella hygida]